MGQISVDTLLLTFFLNFFSAWLSDFQHLVNPYYCDNAGLHCDILVNMLVYVCAYLFSHLLLLLYARSLPIFRQGKWWSDRSSYKTFLNQDICVSVLRHIVFSMVGVEVASFWTYPPQHTHAHLLFLGGGDAKLI